MTRNKTRGFTLIEVMIVVAIIAILAAVAIPSYRDYIRRSQLPEAFTYLSDYRIKMEQYYQDNRSYGAAACVDNPAVPVNWTFADPNLKYFDIVCRPTGAANAQGFQAYTLTATGRTSKAAEGHIYSLTNTGVKATTLFKGASSTATCWLSTGSEC